MIGIFFVFGIGVSLVFRTVFGSVWESRVYVLFRGEGFIDVYEYVFIGFILEV